jgi:hypothetical protein
MQSEATVTEPSQADVGPSEPPAAPATATAATADVTAPRPNRFDRRWLIVLAVVVGYLLQLGWRLWLIRTVTTPIAHADEDRYLLSARVLAGGPGGLGNDTAAFRRMGYPILLAPIYSYTQDPFKVYHAAQVIGATINALAFPLAYLFGRRVLHIRAWLALVLAFVATTLPAIVYYSEFTLTDVLFAPIGLGWLLLLHTWIVGRTRVARIAAIVGAGAVVGYAAAVHVRGLVMLGAHLLAVGYLVLRERSRWKAAVASLVAAIALTRVDWVAQNLVGDRLVRGGVEPGNRLLDRLTDARGLVHILIDATGQLWYAGVATWGLAAVGLVVAWNRVRRDDVEPGDDAQRFILGTTLGSMALIALASSAALPPDSRVSNHAYFRYIAFLMPVFVMLAGDALRGAGIRQAMSLVGRAAALVGVGTVIVLSQIPDYYRLKFERFDTPETSFLTNTWNSMPVAQAAVTSLLLLLIFALAVARRDRRRLAGAALAAVLVLNLTAMVVINAKSVEPMVANEYKYAPRLVHDMGINASDVVATSKKVALGTRLNHQREVYWRDVIEFDHTQSGPPAEATVVVAPWRSRNKDDWHGEQDGWERVAVDPIQEWALWLRAGDPRIEPDRKASKVD